MDFLLVCLDEVARLENYKLKKMSEFISMLELRKKPPVS